MFLMVQFSTTYIEESCEVPSGTYRLKEYSHENVRDDQGARTQQTNHPVTNNASGFHGLDQTLLYNPHTDRSL